jgi:hypothetical protein
MKDINKLQEEFNSGSRSGRNLFFHYFTYIHETASVV